ncbi:unnamed protein product [Anisakis simplex]|uniref:Integrin_alpha2 domain-containing protein n=1 Tax=Anisakis simplex TaxID=6269 RepID=A0A0M3J8A2_ANISI|nr:unnamed protein product [Anisakis simplex]
MVSKQGHFINSSQDRTYTTDSLENVTKPKIFIAMKFQFNINWSHVFNECLEPRYSLYGVDMKSMKPSKSEQVLFKSTFTNTTEREQEYSFKTERVTRSAVTVSVEKGVCRGIDMELKLKTPCEVVEANAGFHNEVSVVHIGENTQEEELTWGVDSTVRVPPKCETVAQLVILEDQHVRSLIYVPISLYHQFPSSSHKPNSETFSSDKKVHSMGFLTSRTRRKRIRCFIRS